MMIRTLFLAALLLAGTPALLAAQGKNPCPDARTQTEMNVCAAERYARAGSLLNARYQRLLAVIAGEPHRVEALRAAQRAWIAFRDAHCAFEASAFEGGTMQPMVEALCRANVTARRSNELALLLRFTDEG
ncbi:lysozyme inhibitor LprI family protein [Longimicrobium sp.]|uniref:lysozyme inhibitor LprI family protein n=1 Tax=Longimicrobium sp. TaxID=2029185 RepID=UPI002E2F35DF|nr:lysozyme inhibitor LprI family protein [Longimicrobium sp.]HEX6042336.1 lysozyme inhibitor LprI family protein [Longimicrobium sp.]